MRGTLLVGNCVVYVCTTTYRYVMWKTIGRDIGCGRISLDQIDIEYTGLVYTQKITNKLLIPKLYNKNVLKN